MGTSSEILDRLAAARRLAELAATVTQELFGTSDFQVERKSDDTPVTRADRETEQLLQQQVLTDFPDDGFVGEEGGERLGDSGYRWIVDPIDGTKSFICGVPLYSTLIAVEKDGRSVIGVISVPALGETVFAMRGGGAWYQQGLQEPTAATVSDRPLADGLFVTSETKTFATRCAPHAYTELETAAYITRTWGDGYGYLLVATGRAEVMVDPLMNLWDAAAIQPIIEEAGGSFTDWEGHPSITSGDGVATNVRARDEVLAITRRYPMPQ